jgi:SWIM zinc finger
VTEQSASLKRTIRLVVSPGADGVGAFSINAGKGACHYAFRELLCEIGGRGFAVHRLGLGTLFHVRVGRPADWSCECKGFLYRGYCRHVLGLLALIRQGKI